jgi:hypothetical protein
MEVCGLVSIDEKSRMERSMELYHTIAMICVKPFKGPDEFNYSDDLERYLP